MRGLRFLIVAALFGVGLSCALSARNPADPASDEYRLNVILQCLVSGRCGAHPVFVGVGYQASSSGIIWTSNDGSNWTEALTTTSGLNEVIFADGRFMALGGRVYTSTDGRNWTDRGPIGVGGFGESLAFGLGRFVAVGEELANPHWSLDGAAWTQTSSIATGISRITFADDRFVVTSEGGANLYSLDGQNWTNATGCAGGNHGLAFGNGRFVGVSGTSACVSTTAGVSFVAHTLPGTNATALTFFSRAGVFVMAGDIGTGIRTSESGETGTWSADRLTGIDLAEVRVLDERVFAGGAGGSIFVSTDGTTWSANIGPGGSFAVRGLAFGLVR